MDRYLDALEVRRLGLSEWYQVRLAKAGVRFISDFYDRPMKDWVSVFGERDAERLEGYLRAVAMYDHVLKDDLTPDEDARRRIMEAKADRAKAATLEAQRAADEQRARSERAEQARRDYDSLWGR